MSTKDRKEREREDRKKLILAAAEEVMNKHGMHGLNIDLIAEHTQLAKGTIYLYFKSKEEILSTLSVNSRKALLQEFKEITKKNLSPLDQLKEVVNTNYAFYTKKPLYFDLISLFETNNKLTETEEMYEIGQQIAQTIKEMAVNAQKNGSLNPAIDPWHLSFCMWGMTVGMLQLIKVKGHYINEKSVISQQKLLDNYIEIISNGMKK